MSWLWMEIRSIDLLSAVMQIFTPSDSSTVFNWHVLLHIVAKFETLTVLVPPSDVAIDLCLSRRPLVSHRDVVLAWDVRPDG